MNAFKLIPLQSVSYILPTAAKSCLFNHHQRKSDNFRLEGELVLAANIILKMFPEQLPSDLLIFPNDSIDLFQDFNHHKT